ncbi:MAG: EamA family transporter [Gaiellales bacterium]
MGLTVLLGVLCAISWGLPDVPLARATRNLGIVPTVIGSLAIGLAVTCPILLFSDGLPHITLRGAILIVGMGVLTLAGYLIGFSAFQQGKVTIVAPTIACEGAVAALFSILLGETMDSRILLLLPVAVIGVVLAAMGESEEGQSSGALRAAIAAVVWGGILVMAAPVADEVGVLWGFILVRVVALVLAIPIGLRLGVVANARFDWKNVAMWGVGDSCASLLYVAAAHRGPVAVAGVLAAQFATVGVVAAMIFLKERLHIRQWIGIGLVIASVTLIAATGAG